MLQALVERGIAPDLVVGASVGAINGAFFAGRPDRAGVESLAAIWRGLRVGDVFPLGLVGGFLGFIGQRPHLLAPDRLRALLGRHLPVARLEEAKVRAPAAFAPASPRRTQKTSPGRRSSTLRA